MITLLIEFFSAVVFNVRMHDLQDHPLIIIGAVGAAMVLIVASQLLIYSTPILLKKVSYQQGMIMTILMPGWGQAALGQRFWGIFLNLSAIFSSSLLSFFILGLGSPLLRVLESLSFIGELNLDFVHFGGVLWTIELYSIVLGFTVFLPLMVLVVYDYHLKWNKAPNNVFVLSLVALLSIPVPGLGNAFLKQSSFAFIILFIQSFLAWLSGSDSYVGLLTILTGIAGFINALINIWKSRNTIKTDDVHGHRKVILSIAVPIALVFSIIFFYGWSNVQASKPKPPRLMGLDYQGNILWQNETGAGWLINNKQSIITLSNLDRKNAAVISSYTIDGKKMWDQTYQCNNEFYASNIAKIGDNYLVFGTEKTADKIFLNTIGVSKTGKISTPKMCPVNKYGELWEAYLAVIECWSDPDGYTIIAEQKAESIDFVYKMLRFDHNSQLITEKTILKDDSYDLKFCGQKDGSFVMASKNYNPDGLLLKYYDSTGKILASRIYGDYFPTSIVQTGDSGLIISCWDFYGNDLESKSLIIIKIDRNGTQQWSRRFDPPKGVVMQRFGKEVSIVETMNGNYAVAYHYGKADRDSIYDPPILHLLMLDTKGKTIFDKGYGEVGNAEHPVLCETTRGLILSQP
ncbi:MAG: hypothetical protein ACM3PP_06810 [Candidatus Saccharibacteria bacterium]